MLLTGLQHRKIAKALERKAARLAPHRPRAQQMKRMACLHIGLARAQESNPAIAPAAKNPLNQIAPKVRPSKPKLVGNNG